MVKLSNDSNTMKPSDFKRWRKSLKLSQKEAAEALGLKRRVVQYYEKGERDGEKVQIPKYIRLACSAVAAGVSDYDGPSREKDPAETQSSEDQSADSQSTSD